MPCRSNSRIHVARESVVTVAAIAYVVAPTSPILSTLPATREKKSLFVAVARFAMVRLLHGYAIRAWRLENMSHASRFGVAVLAAGVLLAISSAAHGQTYQVDTQASRVYARVEPGGRLGHAHGVQGLLTSGNIDLAGTGSFVFNMGSFICDTPEARQYVGLNGSVSSSDQKKTTNNMLGSDVLNVATYPSAIYKITLVTPLDGQTAGQAGRYQLEGSFTLHGATRRVKFVAKAAETQTKGVLRLSGQFTIAQSDYGITPYSAVGGLVTVADDLTIWGDLRLIPGQKK
jgi:polyisoprenoid-binding protein YceI